MSEKTYKANKDSRYICKNCGIAIKIDWMEIKHKAGFSTQHIECPECGQHTIEDKQHS